MLPITIDMRDHLRQEKTGNLPSSLPAIERQLAFSTGTLGLWSSNHFVIYYRDGRVPQPGIVICSLTAEMPYAVRVVKAHSVPLKSQYENSVIQRRRFFRVGKTNGSR
jgi:hypothetical protein